MVELIIIIALILGAIIGYISLAATIIFIIIAWKLKDPLANLLLKICPFMEFKGTIFEGVTVLNIIIYECLAFIIIFSLLSIILNLIIKTSGILEKVLEWTFILKLPFKIAGGILGFVEMYIVVFIALFFLMQFNIGTQYIKQSDGALKILNNSPVLSNLVGNTYDAFNEIYELHSKHFNDKKSYNKEALEVLLKYKVIEKEQVTTLIKKGKLDNYLKD